MTDQDPNLAQLNKVCEQMIHDAYLQRQPALISEIDILIRRGHSPTDIENFVRAVAPKTSQAADHVYLIACFLFRKWLSNN